MAISGGRERSCKGIDCRSELRREELLDAMTGKSQRFLAPKTSSIPAIRYRASICYNDMVGVCLEEWSVLGGQKAELLGADWC